LYVNSTFLYRADGTKLRKQHQYKDGINQYLATKTTEYLDGFQYEGDATLANPTALPSLKFVPTSEGYYNFENNKYIYTYTDHLGNVRLSYAKGTNGSAEALEENSYYPFGVKQQTPAIGVSNPAYKYQYNGKELQEETGWNDYGARMYMSDIGRWGVVDPLAETSRRYSPYAYALNNPMRFIDPDGRSAMDSFYNYHNYSNENRPMFSTDNDGNMYTNPIYQHNSYIDATGAIGNSSEIPSYEELMAYVNNPGGVDFSRFDFSQAGVENGPGHPFNQSEINMLMSAGLISGAVAKSMLSSIALEGTVGTVGRIGTRVAIAESATTFGAVLARALAIGSLLSIKNETPPSGNYYVYVIQGKDEIAKFGVTRQNDPTTRPQSQIPGLNRTRADRGPHSWMFLQGPVNKETAFIYEKYYVWAYTQNTGAMPYAQRYPYADAVTRLLEKFK
ncbi:MAG: hypothetical protein DI539_29020, partial [Flavobacterium psychrophilum]